MTNGALVDGAVNAIKLLVFIELESAPWHSNALLFSMPSGPGKSP